MCIWIWIWIGWIYELKSLFEVGAVVGAGSSRFY